jgi:cellulose 1,4-beta-cellobiosidase
VLTCDACHGSVVTQFQENKLTQFFVQNGKKIEIPGPKWDGIPSGSAALTPELCSAMPKAFGDRDRFEEVGGFAQLNKALAVPMVLVMSIWDDVSRLNFFHAHRPPAGLT